MSTTPSEVEARDYARRYRLIPLQRELLADLLTPVRAYSLLCPPGSRGFLLESVEGGERLARYSFIGYRPEPFEVGEGDPLEALREVAEAEVAPVPGLPRFHGGVVGYLGYELKAECGSPLGGLDDIGEHHSREYAVRGLGGAGPCEKHFHLIQDRVGVTVEPQMVLPR